MTELLLRQQYRASDAAAATTALHAVFGVGDATVDPDGGLVYEQLSLIDDGISVTQISSTGATAHFAVAEAPDLIVLAARTGSLTLTVLGDTIQIGEGQLGVIPIDQPVALSWDEVTLDAFSFPRTSIGRLLGFDSEQVRLHVTRLSPVSAAVTTLWRRTASNLAEGVLQSRELFESDIIRDQVIAALLGITIEAFGISNGAEDEGASDDRIIATAERFMNAHLDRPISVADIARAAGLSVRGLQLAYRRTGGSTPIARLRQLRMEAARSILLERTGRTARIGTIAARLGYSNLGRFSAHYREAYGESPTDTLRRTAPSDAG